MINLPTPYENRMKILLGDEFEQYKKALEEEPVKAFRVNTDKISLEDFKKSYCKIICAAEKILFDEVSE